jgi:hypothetical protein
MATGKREAAIAASESTCPRCAAPRGPGQDYCISCGLRLPAAGGRVASLRRGWIRRLGWYPGDWIWVSLPTLLVAVGGAATAIALTGNESSGAGTTLVAASTPLPARTSLPSTQAAALPSAPEPGAGTTPKKAVLHATGAQPNGSLIWPSSTDGWTIVLISYPSSRGRVAPLATARRAARLGLPEVGVLDSSDFSSLHPGYAIVFSGVYASRGDAEAALTSARATGFGSAYTREISR